MDNHTRRKGIIRLPKIITDWHLHKEENKVARKKTGIFLKRERQNKATESKNGKAAICEMED